MNTRYSCLRSRFLAPVLALLAAGAVQAAPDITVVGTPIVNPGTYFAGNQLSVTYTMKNIGNQAAVASKTRIQIFTPFSTQYTTADFPVGALAAGQQRTETHTVTVDNKAWTGTWEARVRLDTAFEVPEDPPLGNNVATPAPFKLVATLPDLKYQDEISPGPCPIPNAYGGKMQLAFHIHNDSSVPAGATKTRVQIYDRMHNTYSQDFVDTPAIPAHGKVPFVYIKDLPATGTAGSWSVFLVLNDGPVRVNETSAFNNNSDEIGFRVEAAGTAVTPCTITPGLLNPRFEGNNMVFDLWGNAGSTMNIQTSTDMVTWTPLATPTMTSGVNKFSTPKNGVRRYYRAK